MSRQNITSPISILIAGVVVILFLLAGVGTSAVGRLQTAAPTLTPCLPGDDIYESCLEDQADDLTATADAKTATAEAYPYPAGGATPSATPTAQGAPGTITPTLNRTATPTPRGGAGRSPTPTTTALASSTPEPSSLDTPTPTPVSALTCTPGVPVVVRGAGPPRAAYLLYFGDRAVGGGSIGPDGTFSARLVVGRERAGEYDLTVRLRGTRQVLLQLTCAVPEVTPTLLPTARGLR